MGDPILDANLRKADMVLSTLQERIQLAGSNAEESQQRIGAVVQDFNAKYAVVESNKSKLA